mmetsp:Transcript_72682/g.187486  ORF Transcript_72682/g.187486 Transcript_72682/m.187486 type:complete len:200 (+) Transcript_72682:1433-2032(+)
MEHGGMQWDSNCAPLTTETVWQAPPLLVHGQRKPSAQTPGPAAAATLLLLNWIADSATTGSRSLWWLGQPQTHALRRGEVPTFCRRWASHAWHPPVSRGTWPLPRLAALRRLAVSSDSASQRRPSALFLLEALPLSPRVPFWFLGAVLFARWQNSGVCQVGRTMYRPANPLRMGLLGAASVVPCSLWGCQGSNLNDSRA